MSNNEQTDFSAAVLKGVIEHNDPATYFGSTMALDMYIEQAQEQGWLDENKQPTEKGLNHYNSSGLSKFDKTPNRRAYFWNWCQYNKYCEENL